MFTYARGPYVHAMVATVCAGGSGLLWLQAQRHPPFTHVKSHSEEWRMGKGWDTLGSSACSYIPEEGVVVPAGVGGEGPVLPLAVAWSRSLPVYGRPWHP